MAHDKHTLHVSHYDDSATWRSTVTPQDRSWILFVPRAGSPSLYLATETKDSEGHTITSYEPAQAAGSDVRTIRVGPSGDGSIYAFTAATDRAAACGHTERGAVVALLDYIDEKEAAEHDGAAKGAAALAL